MHGTDDRIRRSQGESGTENCTNTDDSVSTGKVSESRSASVFDHMLAKTDAWNPPQSQKVPEISHGNDVDHSAVVQQQTSAYEKTPIKHAGDSMKKCEIQTRAARNLVTDVESTLTVGLRTDHDRDQGQRESKRHRRQKWSKVEEGGDTLPQCGRRSNCDPHDNREDRGLRLAEELDDTTSNNDLNKGEALRHRCHCLLIFPEISIGAMTSLFLFHVITTDIVNTPC